jgi:hypothetical protein
VRAPGEAAPKAAGEAGPLIHRSVRSHGTDQTSSRAILPVTLRYNPRVWQGAPAGPMLSRITIDKDLGGICEIQALPVAGGVVHCRIGGG